MKKHWDNLNLLKLMINAKEATKIIDNYTRRCEYTKEDANIYDNYRDWS